MQPILLEKNTKSPMQSFASLHTIVPHLYNTWHYHKELELMYVIRSKGTRFVGDSIQPFFDGDMVLVGKNVPHLWQNEDRYFQSNKALNAEVILLQFVEDVAGDTFDLPEMMHIKKLFGRALHGIQFFGKTKEKAADIMWRLQEENGDNKIIELFRLLDLFANSKEYRLLSDLAHEPLSTLSSERIRKVCDFLLVNYRRTISVSEVANIANLTEKAFCRFFKQSTQKTLVQFITELRISHACKLLLSNEHSIGEICFESGFNNLSNFNRVFKRTIGNTPREYQKSLEEKGE